MNKDTVAKSIAIPDHVCAMESLLRYVYIDKNNNCSNNYK